jgi:hypothetical protein
MTLKFIWQAILKHCVHVRDVPGAALINGLNIV